MVLSTQLDKIGERKTCFSKRSVSRFGRVIPSAREKVDLDSVLVSKTGKFLSPSGEKKLFSLEAIGEAKGLWRSPIVVSPLKNQSERAAIKTVVAVMEEFRKLDQDIQMSSALTFLYTALMQDKEDGVSVKDLKDTLGLASSSASRNVAYMCHYGGKGHGLLAAREDLNARNRKIVEVTPKGLRVLQSVTGLVTGGHK